MTRLTPTTHAPQFVGVQSLYTILEIEHYQPDETVYFRMIFAAQVSCVYALKNAFAVSADQVQVP